MIFNILKATERLLFLMHDNFLTILFVSLKNKLNLFFKTCRISLCDRKLKKLF